MAPDDPHAVPPVPPVPAEEGVQDEDFEMEVRELEPEELVSAAEMLTRSFWNSPLMQVLAPDEAARPAICRWFFEAEVSYALLYGDAFAAVEDDGTVQGTRLLAKSRQRVRVEHGRMPAGQKGQHVVSRF